MSAILPPFGTLLAFDAAARHSSFTRAAHDLNVSQPAISRRVAELEDDLGAKLFDRSTKPIRLTPAGQKLFDVLRTSLTNLEHAVWDIRKGVSPTFTIAAAPGFLTYWLLPRLPALSASFPDLELRLVTGDRHDSIPEADIHVRFGDGLWPRLRSHKILGEEVFAVCSPGFRHSLGHDPDLSTIMRARLLQLSDRTDRHYDWQHWLTTVGARLPDRLNMIGFDDYSLLVNAALAGQGVALCWAGLLDQFLETGALVRVGAESTQSARGYFATLPVDCAKNSVTQAVVDWLVSQGAAEPRPE